VQLWATLVEFLYQFGDVGSDGAWVDVVIVSEVLNRQLGKEISKAAQFVDVKWNRYDGVITYLWKAVANVTIIDAESELVAAAALEPKNVTKIGTAILIFELFLEPGKTLEKRAPLPGWMPACSGCSFGGSRRNSKGHLCRLP